MSIKIVQRRYASTQPKIWAVGTNLFARTSMVYILASFLSYCRTVKVDQLKQQIEIKTRCLWVKYEAQIIPFRDIDYIDRTRREVMDEIGMTKNGWEAHDLKEIYYIQVVTRDRERIDLCRFVGEGAIMTGWSGVLLGDTYLDIVGTQEEDSVKFARLLSRFICKKTWMERKLEIQRDEKGESHVCTACGHELNSKAKKCIYCGSEEIATQSG